MFPLRDFLKRHCRVTTLEAIPPGAGALLADKSGNGAGAEVYLANPDDFESSLFEFEQGGYGEPRTWKADVVILPDSLTVVLLRTADDACAATTLLAGSLTGATFRLGHVSRASVKSVTDE
jgi:hypothetical protein